MSDFLDKMIADLKEGAERSEGFMRGGRVGIEVARERRGREEKLAAPIFSLGESLGAVGLNAAMGAGLGGLTSLIRGDGHPLRDAAIGAGLGGAGGAAIPIAANYGDKLGPMAAKALRSPLGGAALGAGAGGLAGAIAGEDGGEIARDAALGAGLGAVHNRTLGVQRKLGGLGGGLGGAIGPLGAAVGAGLQDGDASSAAGGALGSLAGGVMGAPVGALGGAIVGVPIGALVNLIRGKDVGDGAAAGAAIGGTAGGLAGAPLGSIVGGHMGQNRFRKDEEPKAKKNAALEQHYTEGATAAANHFGLKEAFLGALGSLAGGALLRGGLGAAAGRFGGSALGRAAGGVLNAAAKPGMAGHLASGAIDMAGSMAGGAIGNRLQGQGAQG